MAFRARRRVKTCGGLSKIGRTGRAVCYLCNHHVMGNSSYVIALGLIGTIITALDVVRTVNSTILRTPSGHRNDRKVKSTAIKLIAAPADIKRDLKLMTSILGIEHYTLIILGAVTEYPILHAPWLLMQLCVIVVEVSVAFVRFFLDGLHVKRNEILQALFTVYNWLQVFCLFHRQAREAN